MHWLHACKKIILDVLFPELCFSCERTIEKTPRLPGLCSACCAEIPLHETFFCARCEARLPDTQKICHRDTPLILAAATDYGNEAVKRLVWQLKYRGRTGAARTLASLLAAYFARLPLRLERTLIVPVPLHRRREHERGFNQSLLIAEELAKILGIPLSVALYRAKTTRPQVGLKNAKERRANVEGCFAVSEPGRLAGMNVILVDDVRTTGATLEEAARALKGAGARRVIGAVAAKAGF